MPKKYVIYIVEDSRLVSEMVKKVMIENFYCDVFLFSDYHELKRKADQSPDIIILDYFLDGLDTDPLLSGEETLRNILRVYPQAKTVIFSGQHELETALELLRIGAIDYVDKNDEDFLEELNLAIGYIIDHDPHAPFEIRLKKVLNSDPIELYTLE